MIGREFRRSEHYAGDDPAIYRPAAWYAERFARFGLVLVDEWPTYVKPVSWRLRKMLPASALERGLQRELAIAAGEVQRVAPAPCGGEGSPLLPVWEGGIGQRSQAEAECERSHGPLLC